MSLDYFLQRLGWRGDLENRTNSIDERNRELGQWSAIDANRVKLDLPIPSKCKTGRARRRNARRPYGAEAERRRRNGHECFNST